MDAPDHITHDKTSALIELNGISKSYHQGLPNEAEILHGLNLRGNHGEFVALMGPSGSGKSTLLNIMGLLEHSTAGSYQLQGREISALNDAELTPLRRSTIGFVFQFHHLLPAFSALENGTMPALMRDGRVSAKQLVHARELLAAVGLAQAMDKRSNELSGGMQQRVAIARALVQEPAQVLADEPTGNLDTGSSDDVFVQLRRMHVERGVTFMIVTDDPRLGARCDRMVELVDGRIALDEKTAHFQDADGCVWGVTARCGGQQRFNWARPVSLTPVGWSLTSSPPAHRPCRCAAPFRCEARRSHRSACCAD